MKYAVWVGAKDGRGIATHFYHGDFAAFLLRVLKLWLVPSLEHETLQEHQEEDIAWTVEGRANCN